MPIAAKNIPGGLPPSILQLTSLINRKIFSRVKDSSEEQKVSLVEKIQLLKRKSPQYSYYIEDFTLKIISNSNLIEGVDGKFTFYSKGRPFFGWFDGTNVFITAPLFQELAQSELFQLIIFLQTLEIGHRDVAQLNISDKEGLEILEYLVQLNKEEAGYGLTSNQKDIFQRRILKDKVKPHTLIEEFDIAPKYSKQVSFNALYFLSSLRQKECVKEINLDDSLDLNDKLLSLFKNDIIPQKTVNVSFISFGSPWHYALWNNLSIETLAGDLLGEYGDQVNIRIERCVEDEEIDAVLSRLNNDQPDILALSIEVGTLHGVQRFLDAYEKQKHPRHQILAMGNQVATYFPEKFIGDKRFPNAIVGIHEGEFVMRGLVECIMGRKKLEKIKNIVYTDKKSGKIIRTPLENLPLTLLPHAPSMHTVKPDVTNMIQSSRGCIFGCSYCTRWSTWNSTKKLEAIGEITEPTASTKWRGFDLDRVFFNIERFVAAGIYEIEFCDDEFFGGYSRSRLARIADFAEGIQKIQDKYQVKLSYRLFTTPLIVARNRDSETSQRQNREVKSMLSKLKKTGLVQVYIGLESGSMDQKARYDRRETIDDTTMALEVLRELELDIDVGFIMFDPQLTISEMLENVAYFKHYGLVKHNTWPFRPLVVNEGTAIKFRLEADGLLNGRQDANFLAYDYTYENPVVGRIADLVQLIAKESAVIFYTCKNISKTHWKSNPTPRTERALWYIEENAIIYLDLMKILGENALKDEKDRMSEDLILSETRRRLFELVEQVKVEISEGGTFYPFENDRKILLKHINEFDKNYGELYANSAKTVLTLS